MGTGRSEQTERLAEALRSADAVVIGAGAGLSSSAGFAYSGERFERYFGDFEAKYHFHDMYSGGFNEYDCDEERWAFWSRFIYINRYQKVPKNTYEKLLSLVQKKDYYVLTTNVDHQFQKAGFSKERLFYTQGDYGLFQCSTPCHRRTYENKGTIVKMLYAQGFLIDEDGTLIPPEKEDGNTDFSAVSMRVPAELIPCCPVCGEQMTINLRGSDRFVEDAGWNSAADRYSRFIKLHKYSKTLFLELGVGYNTPSIIKYPFWQLTYEWPDAMFACINAGQAYAPKEIAEKSILIDGDIAEIVDQL